MTGAAHTPGPWQRKSDYEPNIIIGNVDGEIHADGSTSYTYDFIANLEDEYGGSPANAYANDALILAAPELYEYVESSAQNGCATAQALIAKARGDAA